MIFFCDIASDAGSCRRLIAILDSTGENLRVLKTGREELEKVSVIIPLSTCTYSPSSTTATSSTA